MAEAKHTTRTTTRTTKAATKPAADAVSETASVAEDTASAMTDATERAMANAKSAANDMMEMFKMPAKTFTDVFQFQPVEMPPVFRDWAEKSVSQVRDAYDRAKVSAEEASDVMEDTFETTRKGMVDFNIKALEATKANTDATFDFFRKAMGAKSIAEAVELQSSFARECMDSYTAQVKDMQEFGQKFAEDVSKPVKSSVDKAMKDFKAA